VPTAYSSGTRTVGAQGGTATVEFALVLPLLLVMCLALVQVGLLARDRLLVEAVARAGARRSIVLLSPPARESTFRVILLRRSALLSVQPRAAVRSAPSVRGRKGEAPSA
jgi:Flp pilus assembly protein TadG